MLARAALLALVATSSLQAQDRPRRPHRATDGIVSLAGAGLAFVGHESGHLSLDLLFGADPYLGPVHFGPIPFFAIEGRNPVTPAQRFMIASAGFWVQEATNEWILSTRPRLRHERAPLVKGMLAFNVLMPAGYAVGALLRVGPQQRDPRSMSVASGIAEPVIGLLVLTPALLDGYRFLHPEKRWPVWVSRAVKVGSLALTLRAASR